MSLLRKEAEKLLQKYNLSLTGSKGRYTVVLPSGEKVYFTSLSQIITLFSYLQQKQTISEE